MRFAGHDEVARCYRALADDGWGLLARAAAAVSRSTNTEFTCGRQAAFGCLFPGDDFVVEVAGRDLAAESSQSGQPEG